MIFDRRQWLIKNILVAFFVTSTLSNCSAPLRQSLRSHFIELPQPGETDNTFILALAKWQQTQPVIQYYQHQHSSNALRKLNTYLTRGMTIRNNTPLSPHAPVDWAANLKSDHNWMFQKNAMYVLAPFIQMHVQTNKPEYHNIAKNLLLDWIDYNQTQNMENPFKWYDMSTGLRAISLAYVVDVELRASNPDVLALETMIRSLLVHAEELSDHDKLAMGNHAYFQLLGLVAICKALPLLKLCPSALVYANDEMNELIISQFTREGIQREHAPSYHFYSLGRAKKVLKTDWFNLSQEALKRLDLAEQNKAWLHHPNGTLAMIGDSVRGKTQNGVFDSILAIGNLTDEYGKTFPLSGYAVLRSNWSEGPAEENSYVLFWAGEERPGESRPHSYGHSHSDNFTFEWSEGLVPILTDSGKYSYERNEWRDFFVSTKAHNTLEIDSRDTINSRSENRSDMRWALPRILSTSSHAGLQHVEASMTRTRSNAEHRRLLVLNPGKWLAVVDSLSSSEPKEVVQWFHFHEDWHLVNSDNNIFGTHANATVGVFTLLDRNRAYITKGATEPQIQGWVSTDYMKRTPRFSLGYKSVGEQVEFVTLFLLGAKQGAKLDKTNVSIKEDSIEVCWSINNQVDGFTFTSSTINSQSKCY